MNRQPIHDMTREKKPNKRTNCGRHGVCTSCIAIKMHNYYHFQMSTHVIWFGSFVWFIYLLVRWSMHTIDSIRRWLQLNWNARVKLEPPCECDGNEIQQDKMCNEWSEDKRERETTTKQQTCIHIQSEWKLNANDASFSSRYCARIHFIWNSIHCWIWAVNFCHWKLTK